MQNLEIIVGMLWIAGEHSIEQSTYKQQYVAVFGK